MNKLIELLEEVLDKSEKNKDGSYLVPKWLSRKIVKALNDNRKIEKKENKKKVTDIEPKIIKHINENIIEDNSEIQWGRRKVKSNDRKVIYDIE